MTQTAAGPIALTSDGQPIFPARLVEPGQHQPLGVLADGRPVWPVAPGAGPAGQPQPLGVLPDGTFLFAAGQPVAARPSKPLWQKKRILIPAGLLVVGLVSSAVSSGSKTEITPSGNSNATASAPKAPAKTEAELAADKAAAEKAAADKAVADKAAAKKAAADKAAADKAAAKKAAADKAAAATKAAADKVAAAKAAAEQAAADKAAAEAAARTAGQNNAREKADDYLSMAGFSRSGLINQLKFEGFSVADATYGVDSLNVNWNKQAARKAQDYLDMSAFSRSGLIDQLTFEGFTGTQAAYGVSQVGL